MVGTHGGIDSRFRFREVNKRTRRRQKWLGGEALPKSVLVQANMSCDCVTPGTFLRPEVDQV